MELEGVTIKTEYKYIDFGDYRNDKKFEYLLLEIPLPGGKAQYEIALSDGVKENIEMAIKLSKGDKK